MLKWIKCIVTLAAKCLGSIVGIVFRKNYVSGFRVFINILYTAFLSKKFKKIGEHTFINYPIEYVGEDCISIGNNSIVGKESFITAWKSYTKKRYNPSIEIGNDVSIGNLNHITSINKIVIGDGVLTGKMVTITDNSHGMNILNELYIAPLKRNLHSKGPVVIEENVWIGDKATILPNVIVGKNSIIAANSVVTKNIPSNCIAAGVPAQVIRYIK